MSSHTQHSRFPQSDTAEGVRALPSRTVCSLIQTHVHVLLTVLSVFSGNLSFLLARIKEPKREDEELAHPCHALFIFLPLHVPSKKEECLRDS